MRDFLNAILEIIGSTSLTDLEFATITETIPAYTQGVYDQLTAVLQSRESVSIYQDRLTAYFYARGADITPATVGKSNILMGGSIEY